MSNESMPNNESIPKNESIPNPDRRNFLKQAATVAIAAGIPARSYGRIIGANDRIQLAQLGCGGRSSGHVHMVELASKQTPVETIACCDIWSLAAQARAAQAKAAFNLEPKVYKYSEEMLANKDIDAVMIATGDFQHAKLCAEVVKAGKDCYVEKPFANVLSEAIETRNIVKASKQMVQVGSQHRSEPYQLAVRDIVRSGRIGDVVHIEQEWNVNQERWRWVASDTGGGPGARGGMGGMMAAYQNASPEEKTKMMETFRAQRAQMSEHEAARYADWQVELWGHPSKLREEDTDWNRWLLGKPYEPFDPHKYLEFRLYKNYSSGIFDQWMSHGSDLVHLFTDSLYPTSVVANGGIFAWRDSRENPDTAVASVTYPKGFLYTFKVNFGNSYRSFSRVMGTKGTLVNYGGEGASLWTVSKEGGPQEASGSVDYTSMPIVSPASEGEEVVTVPGADPPNSRGPGDDSVVHIMNWLNSIRSRQIPNANVDYGFAAAVVIIMAAHSYWSGTKLYWNPETEQILDHPTFS
jgi:predicted dehydrogenase